MRLLPVALAAVLLSAPSAAPAAVIVLDPMTLEFPPNACFPVMSPRVLACGSYCDATACPPGVPVNVSSPGPCSQTAQSGFLPELGGTSRFSLVEGGTSGTSVRARVVPAETRTEVVTEGGAYSDLYVAFGDHASFQWSTDLVQLGAQSIRAVVSGDITPAHPVYLEVMLFSGDANAGVYSNSWIPIDAPGTYEFPIASFEGWPAGNPPANLHDVNLIDFLLSDCFEQNCVGSGFPGRSYSLGPLSLVTNGPTKTLRSTWAHVKQIYR